MDEPQFQKTPRKANNWFRAFIILAVLYGITFSLVSLFNWIFFFAAVYCLFMSYFLLPEQPRIFQNRPNASRATFDREGRSTSNVTDQPVERIKRVVKIIVFSVVGFFVLLIVVGIFSPDDEDQTTITSEEQSGAPADDSNSAANLTSKGNDLFNNAQYDSADAYYARALEIDPNYMEAVYGKGIVLYQKGARDEANVYFTRSYDGGYRYAWLSWVLGDSYDKSGATVRAIELYKESINLDSAYVDSYNRLAELVPAERDKYLELARKHADD